jgi:hypothetical protein
MGKHELLGADQTPIGPEMADGSGIGLPPFDQGVLAMIEWATATTGHEELLRIKSQLDAVSANRRQRSASGE